MKECDKRKKML